MNRWANLPTSSTLREFGYLSKSGNIGLVIWLKTLKMSGFNLRRYQIVLQRYNGVDISIVIAHHILTRLATSKYLAEHFDPCRVNATSKISRSSSGGRYGRRSVSKDIFWEVVRKGKSLAQNSCQEFREQKPQDIRFSDLPGVTEKLVSGFWSSGDVGSR